MTQLSVWMLSEQIELHWTPLSLHVSRESALHAIPAGARQVGRRPEVWHVPPATDAGSDRTLRVQEWPVVSS